MRILVTGASGFVGRALVSRLADAGHEVVAAVRSAASAGDGLMTTVAVGDIRSADWGAALDGVDAVVHLAARAHVMRDKSADPLSEFRDVNVAGTKRLAEAAMRHGVGRFVFVSTIGVNGRKTEGRPFTAADAPAPAEPYAIAKREAEDVLLSWAGPSFEPVVVRPTLVYGPGAPGNMARLVKAVAAGWPMPFAGIRNRRSLIGVENLADILELSCSRPAVGGIVVLAADPTPVSTSDMLTAVASGLSRRPRLFRMPRPVLGMLLKAAGGRTLRDQLLGDLEVDVAETQRLLSWVPAMDTLAGLAEMARPRR